MTLIELARVGYEAYGEERDWIAVNGDPMPEWDDLGEPIQSGWLAVAVAMRRTGEV